MCKYTLVHELTVWRFPTEHKHMRARTATLTPTPPPPPPHLHGLVCMLPARQRQARPGSRTEPPSHRDRAYATRTAQLLCVKCAQRMHACLACMCMRVSVRVCKYYMHDGMFSFVLNGNKDSTHRRAHCEQHKTDTNDGDDDDDDSDENQIGRANIRMRRGAQTHNTHGRMSICDD